MPFTFATVTHSYVNADGTPGSGSLEFTLQATMTNAGVTLAGGTHVVRQIDASGNVSQALASTQDDGTVSDGLPVWRCDERVSGSPTRPFVFAVPSGGVTLDLGALMPFNTPPLPG